MWLFFEWVDQNIKRISWGQRFVKSGHFLKESCTDEMCNKQIYLSMLSNLTQLMTKQIPSSPLRVDFLMTDVDLVSNENRSICSLLQPLYCLQIKGGQSSTIDNSHLHQPLIEQKGIAVSPPGKKYWRKKVQGSQLTKTEALQIFPLLLINELDLSIW